MRPWFGTTLFTVALVWATRASLVWTTETCYPLEVDSTLGLNENSIMKVPTFYRLDCRVGIRGVLVDSAIRFDKPHTVLEAGRELLTFTLALMLIDIIEGTNETSAFGTQFNH